MFQNIDWANLQNPHLFINGDGSASSLIACHKLGFEYWGFEIDPDYYALATARLEAVKAQMTFFDTERLDQNQISFMEEL